MVNKKQILLVVLCSSGCGMTGEIKSPSSSSTTVSETTTPVTSTGAKLKVIVNPKVLPFGGSAIVSVSGGTAPYEAKVLTASGTIKKRTNSTGVFDYVAPAFSANTKLMLTDGNGNELEFNIPVTKTGRLNDSLLVEVTPGNEFAPDEEVFLKVSGVLWNSTGGFLPNCRVPFSQGAFESSAAASGNINSLGIQSDGSYLFRVTPASRSHLRECRFTDQRSDSDYVPLRTVPADLQADCEAIVVEEASDVLDQVSTRSNPRGGVPSGSLQQVRGEVVLLNGRKICSVPEPTTNYPAYVGDSVSTQLFCPSGWYRYDWITNVPGSSEVRVPYTITAPRRIRNATDGWGSTSEVSTGSHSSFGPGVELRDTCLARNLTGNCSSNKNFYAFLRRMACYR